MKQLNEMTFEERELLWNGMIFGANALLVRLLTEPNKPVDPLGAIAKVYFLLREKPDVFSDEATKRTGSFESFLRSYFPEDLPNAL